MGAQQILRAVALVAAVARVASAAPAPRLHERVAVIDLGPDDSVRQRLATSVVAAGLDAVGGDGLDEALAGKRGDVDGAQLAAAMDEAKRKFGELACPETIVSATSAITIAAARQAAGLPVPELTRAWTYVLLCNDRNGDTGYAMVAASQLRNLGGSSVVPKDVWDRYPAVDTLVDPRTVDTAITAVGAAPPNGAAQSIDGAQIWIDGQAAGVAPLHVVLPLGVHIVAAASGTQRGAKIAVIEAKPAHLDVAVELVEQQRPWNDVAERVASWHGAIPAVTEIDWVLVRVRARIALIRVGDHVEIWGQAGRAEQPHRLGNDEGAGAIADVDRLLALAVDRLHVWNDHAPDPDRELLLDDPRTRKALTDRNQPTKWWVYAAIIGAVAVGAAIVYIHDNESDVQHVDLHYP